MNIGDSYSKTFNIPISHLDYSYITNCNNIQELEKIYFTLHVGEEGHFPDLENHCEKKLKKLNPNSRVLRKAEDIKCTKELDDELKINLTKEFENFIIEAQQTDSELLDTNNNNIKNSSNNNNHPIRGKSILKENKQNKVNNQNKNNFKSPVPKNYAEWSKIAANLDKEILEDEPEEMNEKEKQRMKEEASKTQAENTKMLLKGVSSKIDTTGMTNSEKNKLVTSEKEKGNESFKSGDYIESITYYTRSLSVMPTSTVYNNRGFAYMKQNKWKEALCDLNEAIKLEPNNVKALYRRAKCNYEIHDLKSCIVDCRNYLKLDPDCKLTQKLLDDAEAELQKRSQPRLKDGKRIVITEVDSDDESEEEFPVSKPVISRPAVTQSNESKVNLEEANKSEDNQKENSKPEVNEKIQSEHVQNLKCSEDLTKTYEQIKDEGNVYFKENKYSDALLKYSKLIELDPNNAIGYRNRAMCYLSLNDPITAIEDCNEAIRLDGNSYLSFYRRGRAYKLLEDFEQSVYDLEMALKLNPGNRQIQEQVDVVKNQLYEQKIKKEQGNNRDSDKDSNGDWEFVDGSQSPGPAISPQVPQSDKLDPIVPSKEEAVLETHVDEVPETLIATNSEMLTPLQFHKELSIIRQKVTRNKDGIDWRPTIQLCVNVGTENIVKLMGNKLDGFTLETIISAVEIYSMNEAHAEFIMKLLSNICEMDRFEFVKMMLPDYSVTQIKTILERLKQNDANQCMEADLKKLEMKLLS